MKDKTSQKPNLEASDTKADKLRLLGAQIDTLTIIGWLSYRPLESEDFWEDVRYKADLYCLFYEDVVQYRLKLIEEYKALKEENEEV
jgi:hypothetical protein